jgi:predicted patatin/cPLA2 family phospholipase
MGLRQTRLSRALFLVLTVVVSSIHDTANGYLQSNKDIFTSPSALLHTYFEGRAGHLRSRRDSCLNTLRFRRQPRAAKVQSVETTKYRITTVKELDDYFSDTALRFRKSNGEINSNELLKALDVRGDTQIIGSPDRPDYTHPVVQLLHNRRRQVENGFNKTSDGAKVALAVEGGGMRGCVSAGMIGAIHHLNLTSAFDVVYGSSAGTVIAAYLITGQLPWFGPEVYYDRLTTAGREFIDTRRVLRAVGFGLLDPRLFKDVVTRPNHGKPVLNLPFLLKTTLQDTKPLDWDKFVEKQKELPLKVVVSGLKSEKSLVLDYAGGYFESLSELADCMHASCLIPGIAGPIMNMDRRAIGSKKQAGLKKYVLRNNLQGEQYEPLADALVYEPLPFNSAIAEGATHIVVIRSIPVRQSNCKPLISLSATF